jgi:hypothetical protein
VPVEDRLPIAMLLGLSETCESENKQNYINMLQQEVGVYAACIKGPGSNQRLTSGIGWNFM